MLSRRGEIRLKHHLSSVSQTTLPIDCSSTISKKRVSTKHRDTLKYIGKAQITLIWKMASEDCTFEEQFRNFAKFGDAKSTGETITLSNSDKWFKQAKVIDGKTVTTTDTGIYFKQISKAKKALNLNEYNQFLETVAKNKKLSFDELKEKLTNCGLPGTSRTTTSAKGGAVGRLTDHTKFTGTHKQRFDESGRGKGREGREEIHDNSGYVQGYGAEGSYDKTH